LLLIGADQDVDLLDVGLGLLRGELAAYPAPDRIEAGARNTAAVLALDVIDQERLEGREKQPLRIARPWGRTAGATRFAAQLSENHLCAWRLFAAREGAFELRREKRFRFRLQLAQVLPQLVLGDRVGHAPPSTQSRFWLELAIGR